MERMPQALVTLDDRRTAMTDSQGHFRFSGVNAGDHRIRLEYNSGRQHYFTTPQDATVAGGSTINFGIAFSTIDLWGYVEDDAGHGLEKVKLQIIGASGKIVTATNTSGKFILPDVEPGNYQIQVDPESVPIGYSTVDLEPPALPLVRSSKFQLSEY